MEKSNPDPALSGVVVITSRVLRIAVAAYLARFKGQSRIHTESDLRGYLVWCELRGLAPLASTRPHVELCIHWLQEVLPVPTIDGVAAHVGRRAPLPDMRDRRRT